MNSEEDEARRQYERAKYEALLEDEEMAIQAQYENEAEAQMQHEEECKALPLKIIINAIIEQQEKGQISPQTIEDLKILLRNIEVIEKL